MYAEQLENLEHQLTDHDDESSTRTQPQVYRPESPFLSEPEYERESQGSHSPLTVIQENGSYRESIETPFITQYELDGTTSESAELGLFREIMEELYDPEFEGAVTDLINDVRGVYQDRFNGELDQGSVETEQQMWMYLQPLDSALNGAIESLAQGLVSIDNESLTEEQLDHYLEAFEYETNFEQPEFEAFFGKIWKKVKKVAKKGLKVLKKLSPIHILLGKLKKLVRPLLKRVLKFALNKVPARFRPLARRLARRFFKGALREIEESEFDGEMLLLEDFIEQSELESLDAEAAAPPPGMIAAEFDAFFASYIIEGEDIDRNPTVAQYLNEEALEDEQAADVLDNARDRFIRKIGAAESEAEVIAEIERFIPAILMGLKLGIKLIGRKRVVNFLAKLVAKLIRKFVGRRAAVPLSRVLVDAGLRTVSLESPVDLEYASGEILAETIKETIDEFATYASEEVFEDEELMDLYVQEAFDHAVARNFPPQLVRRDLRQAPASKGTWLMFPRGRRRKRYKKFTETFNVKITSQMAKRIGSFGGQSLYGFLKDQLGLPIDSQEVGARLHLYEGIRGTLLSDISHLEKGIEGLGSRDRSAWMKIHPLTRRAAALLIPEYAGLGKRVNPRFLAKRTRTAVGQRFYYLEVPGARVMRAPPAPAARVGARRPPKPAPARASEVNVTLDFRSREIRVYNYLSEVQATEIAQRVRRGQSRVTLVRALRATLSSSLRVILSGSPGKHLRIKREIQAEEGMIAGLAQILRFVGRTVSRKVTDFIVKQLLNAMKREGKVFSQDFVKAAEAREDGVTVIFTLSQVGEVFAVFSGNTMKRVKALASLRSTGITGSMKIDVKAGFNRE